MHVVSSNSQVVQLVQLVQKFLEVQEDPMFDANIFDAKKEDRVRGEKRGSK